MGCAVAAPQGVGRGSGGGRVGRAGVDWWGKASGGARLPFLCGVRVGCCGGSVLEQPGFASAALGAEVEGVATVFFGEECLGGLAEVAGVGWEDDGDFDAVVLEFLEDGACFAGAEVEEVIGEVVGVEQEAVDAVFQALLDDDGGVVGCFE